MNNSVGFDNRWSERQCVCLDVTLLDDGQEVLQTTSKDISIGGIFIATASQPFDIDKQLHVAFTLRNANGDQHHSLPARVVRQHNGGTGLAFRDYNIQNLNALRVLLYDGAVTR